MEFHACMIMKHFFKVSLVVAWARLKFIHSNGMPALKQDIIQIVFSNYHHKR